MKSKEQLCAMFPSPSYPSWVWYLFCNYSLLAGTSLWKLLEKHTFKKRKERKEGREESEGREERSFRFLHSIQQVAHTPLYLGHQRRGRMVTEGHPSDRTFVGKQHPDSNQLHLGVQKKALGGRQYTLSRSG